MAALGWMVRGFGLAFESNRISIPAMGSYCLVTLMISDRTKQICLWMTIYIYILEIKLADHSQGRTEGSFSIATTPKCMWGCYSFSWIASLTLDSSLNCCALSKYATSTIFWVFGMTQPRIQPLVAQTSANTWTMMLIGQYIYIYNLTHLSQHPIPFL